MNPYIVSSPPSEIRVQSIGDSVNLACSAGGAPLPDGKWFKDGRPVVPTAIRQEQKLTTSKLVIDQFKASDSGIYTCLFHNDKNRTVEADTNLSMYMSFSCSCIRINEHIFSTTTFIEKECLKIAESLCF